jgi:excisionase family DNA binding protein
MKGGTSAAAVKGAITEEVAEHPTLLSVPTACRFLGVHRNTLYKLIREGQIPAFRLIRGGRWRFKKVDLEQWLEDRQGRGAQ